MPSYELDRPLCTNLFMIYISFTVLWVSANANFYEERFKSLAHHEPWSSIDQEADATQEFASSEYAPSYSRFPESRKRETFESSESFDRPNKEWFLASSSKRVPLEDKHFKKIISPFYTITEKDSQKYKDIVMKSGIPYCQEIKTKKPSKEANTKESTICYKCKNPKNGATYEQCSYVSQPSTGSGDREEVADDPSGLRNRRSNSDEATYGFTGSHDYKRHDNPYRFNEKFFSDASDGVPAEYKNKDEECEKVSKDSMVCMVCRDTKSNAKYEQCSYVRQPNEKSYAFSKSSSFKNPEENKEKEDDEESESKPVREHSKFSRKKSQKSDEGSKESSDSCREVEKGSQTCTVCKDPETGGNYEKCSYTYQPNDKVYKYSTSKSFGYPRKSSSDSNDKHEKSDYKDEEPSHEGSGKSPEKLTREAEDEYKRDYSIPETSYFKDDKAEYSYHPEASENSKSTSEDDDPLSGYARSKSQSERIAESIEPSHCKKVRKGSLSCKVCKDPKTGSNSEQCSYEQQPSEKNYSYSKSKSFGGPTDGEDESQDGSESKGSLETYKDRSFGFFGDERPSDNEKDTGESSKIDVESKDEESTSRSAPKKVDAEFYDAFKKKAEIQKFLQEFQKEDRSNCKKLMRGKMTCYQCVDEKGFRKEECAFITDGEAAEDKTDESEEGPGKKVPRSLASEREEDVPAEPEASASGNVEMKQKKLQAEDSEEAGKSKEAEAYEYVAETRPVYDKVLGIELPAYMLAISENEEEFDRIVASDV